MMMKYIERFQPMTSLYRARPAGGEGTEHTESPFSTAIAVTMFDYK